MVRQFADPYAFVRELVQNSIDAGASEIHVRAEPRHDGTIALSVSDDGEGMTRDIIEGPLLTLFNSAKDEQTGKIGKYGIGFVSVFGVGPSRVVVESWRAEGSWQLTLLPDHSYELAVGNERDGSGTTVSLILPPGDDDTDHGERTRAALLRWCRHAAVPIHWTQQRHSQPLERQRIDRALDIDSPVTVESRSDGSHILLGPSMGDERRSADDLERGETFVGFYNHGLTLFETSDPPHPKLSGLRVKILSDGLQHTLSRDNVRRDRAYDKALRAAVRLAGDTLTEAVKQQLRSAAATAAAGGNVTEYEQLLHVVQRKPLGLEAHDISLALTDAIDGTQVMHALACLWPSDIYVRSTESTALTQALAREGKPVLAAASPLVNASLEQLLGQRLASVEAMVRAVWVAAPEPTAAALCVQTHKALAAAGARVGAVELGETDDHAARAAVPAQPEQPALLDRREWPDWADGCASLRIMVQHGAVERALGLAATDAPMAGALLARYLLVERDGEVSSKASEALLRFGRGDA